MKKAPIEENQPADDAAIARETQADEIPAAQADSSAPTQDAAAAKVLELTSDLQRTRADFENYRKQAELQRTQAMSAAKYATVEKFLPLVDDFERAISSYPDQLSPLAKSFEKTLSTLGLSKINSEPGADFNPDFHDAISIEDDDGDIEVIAETLRPGYLYDNSVIRPAMVKVKRISK